MLIRKHYRIFLLAVMIGLIGAILVFGKGTILSKYYYMSGLRKIKLSDYHGAVLEYSRAIAFDGGSVTGFLSRGSAYMDLHKYSDALIDFTRAVELSPEDAETYTERGKAYYEVGLYEKALADFNKAIRINKEYGYAYYYRGLIKCTSSRDFGGGCNDFKQAEKYGIDEARDAIKTAGCE